jgi:hypothetical protein
MWLPPALIPARLTADPSRRHLAARLGFSVTALAVLAGAPAIAPWLAAWTGAGCLARAVLGLPCPGCGVTTSLIALCAGDLGGAIRSNPAGLAIAAALAAQAAIAVIGLWRPGPLAWARSWLTRQDGLALAALGAALIARLWRAW